MLPVVCAPVKAIEAYAPTFMIIIKYTVDCMGSAIKFFCECDEIGQSPRFLTFTNGRSQKSSVIPK